MPAIVPTNLDQLLAAMADHVDAIPLAGGTDLMVEVNEAQRRLDSPATTVIALNRVAELRTWSADEKSVTIGAAVTWSELERSPLAERLPALAQAARTVGSPQIRAAGTIGGNLATCSPAGDGLPVLAAYDASINLVSPDGSRSMSLAAFMTGVKQTALGQNEIVQSVTLPILSGFQGYSKVGVRNAMVIATAGVCVAVDEPTRSVRIALGSVAPTIVRADEAERLAHELIDWEQMSLADGEAHRIGTIAASVASPITDHRSTADYRRHAVSVMTKRLIERATVRRGAA